MMSLTNTTVEDFFQGANWLGLPQLREVISENIHTIVTEESIEVDFSLTVENFFSLNNWSGKPILKTVTVTETPQAKAEVYQPVYTMKMTVEEFFLRMVWQGQPQSYSRNTKTIASAPLINESESLSNLDDNSINVNDLSDLF